jgi:hypothetical protein
MRKLALPALAACALLAAGAPAVQAKPAKAHAAASLGSKLSKVSGALKGLQKAVSLMGDVNDGQTGAINGVDERVTTVVANLSGLDAKVTAVITASTAALTKLQDAALALKAGLETLGAAVQGPGVAGQLGAVGTVNPGANNDATPTTLPTGTVYRQIVLSTAANGGLPAGTPIGVRLWIKMPNVTGLYSNAYTCLSGRVNSTASGAAAQSGGAAYAATLTDCPGGS